MQYFPQKVVVGTTSPPEDVLQSLAGGFGLWQMLIIVLSCMARFIFALEVTTSSKSVLNLKFTCKDSNGSQCFNINGTKCEHFEFERYEDLITLTEKFLYVCDRSHYSFWIENAYVFGLLVGPLFVGYCANKFGVKDTSIIFISLQCITGLIMINRTALGWLMICFHLHGVFSSALRIFPVYIVCNVVGNKWRTFALGVLATSSSIALFLFPTIAKLFTDLAGVICLNSILPLLLLVPLLHHRHSPNHVLFMQNYKKAEQTLQMICILNKRPMSPNGKVCPVQVIVDEQLTQPTTIFSIWKPKNTRKAYIALLSIEFFLGFYVTLGHTHYSKHINTSMTSELSSFGGVVLVSTICHVISCKIIIGVNAFARSIIFAVIFFCDEDWSNSKPTVMYLLIVLSMTSLEMYKAILDILVPRMFPTYVRCIGLGLCYSVRQLGRLLARLLSPSMYRSDHTVMNVVYLCFFIITPILETIACFFLWDVHNRELPDLLIDCVRFKKYYKPTRFYYIEDNASEHEIEVKQLDLTREDLFRRKIPGE